MAETMLFVNDHLNGELWDGPEDPPAIRNFGPGDYIVFRTGRRRPRDHQRAPGREGHVRPVPAGVRDPRGRRRPALRRRRQPQGATPPSSSRSCSRRRHEDPRLADVRGALQRQRARRRARAAAAATSPSPTGPPSAARSAEVSDRGGGTIRIPNPPWHFSDAEVGLRGGPKYRGEDNRAVLAEVLGYDDATIDGLEADGVLSSRVPSSAHEPALARRPDEGDARHAAGRGRRLGLRDQVGRLPHARLRRRRQGPPAELEPRSTSRRATRSCSRSPPSWAGSGRSSTASSSCSTSAGGRGSS